MQLPANRLTKRLILLFLACNACSTVPLPHTDLCVENALENKAKCYWIDTDYNQDGTLKATAVPNYKDLNTIQDVNKNICTDPDSWALLKAYIKTLRTELQQGG